MCTHLRNSVSPILAPVSLISCRRVAVFGAADAISMSNSSSVGMNGSPVFSVYFGFCHFLPMNLRYPLYIPTKLFLVLFAQFMFDRVSLTSSGSSMLHCFDICRRHVRFERWVGSALPFFFSSHTYCSIECVFSRWIVPVLGETHLPHGCR